MTQAKKLTLTVNTVFFSLSLSKSLLQFEHLYPSIMQFDLDEDT